MKNNKFYKSVIWLLLTISIGSSGGLAYTLIEMKIDVNRNKESIRDLKGIMTSISLIRAGVATLVEYNKDQKVAYTNSRSFVNKIYGIQKERSYPIKQMKEHMNNYSIHNYGE